MPNPGVSPQEAERRTEVVQRHIAQGYGWMSRAARELDLDRTTLQSWCKRLGLRADGPETHVADGFALRGYSEFTKTEHGTPIWLKTVKAEQDYYAAVIEAIGNRPARALDIPPPRVQTFDARDVVPWLNIGDAHIGMLAHEVEAAANFDLKIAKAEILQAAFDLIDLAPDCETMVINDLGDGTHYENMKAETERSGHQLDYDGRFYKMIEAYLDIMEAIIEKALRKARQVHVIINQGNHSETNDYWAAMHFRRLYSRVGDDRVKVLPNLSPFIGYRMGKTFVLVHHGHKAKPETLRQIMSSDYAIDWGEASFRYIDGGHIHHFSAKELGGAEWCSFNNLAPVDKHAHDGGWRSKQAMTLVLRSRTYGDLGRHKMPVERVWDRIRETCPGHYVPAPKRAFQG
jgi:hypothetical protein